MAFNGWTCFNLNVTYTLSLFGKNYKIEIVV